jgi:thioesterase domain-containing protein
MLAGTRSLVQAIDSYTPDTLPSTVDFFAADSAEPGDDPTRGWASLLQGRLRLHQVGGDHWSILRGEALPALAGALNHSLRTCAALSGQPAPEGPTDRADHTDRTAMPGLADAGKSATATAMAAAAHDSLVVIQAGQAGHTPWLALPGAGASVTCFVPLAQALGPDVPLYGLQAQGLDGQLTPIATVQAAAHAHVQAMEAAGLRGPVHLVGHSFGGWLAFELARQLRQRGVAVSRLLLLDSSAPSPLGPRRRPVDEAEAAMELARLIGQQSGRTLALDDAALRAMDPAQHAQALHAAMTAAGVLPARAPLSHVQGLLRVFSCNINTGYEPDGKLDVPLTLVWAQDATRDRAVDTAQWAQWAPVEQVVQGGGNHMSMLASPHIAHAIQGAIPDNASPAWRKMEHHRV